MNTIINNKELYSKKRINNYNNTIKNKMNNINSSYNTINKLNSKSFYNIIENPKQIKIKYYKNIFSRKNININNNNNKLILRNYGNQIQNNKTNINKKENNIESYAYKGNLIRNISEKKFNFIPMNSKNNKIKSRNNETFTNKNINSINSKYQSAIKKQLLKNSIQLTNSLKEKDKILRSDLMSNSVENIYKFFDKGKNRLFNNNIYDVNKNNIERIRKFIYQTPKNIKFHQKNLSQINNTFSNINIENNFIFPINNFSNYKKIEHLYI